MRAAPHQVVVRQEVRAHAEARRKPGIRKRNVVEVTVPLRVSGFARAGPMDVLPDPGCQPRAPAKLDIDRVGGSNTGKGHAPCTY